MKNYDGKTDCEIASLVLTARGISHKIECGTCFIYEGYEDGACMYSAFDPCGRAQDSWPIIVENKINIEWRDSVRLNPLAKGTGGSEYWHADKNPLRAAMICFIKMKDAEK